MPEPRTAFVNLSVGNPLVAWLVYRGEMVSAGEIHESTLSFWLMRELSVEASGGRRGARLRDEVALEVRRAEDHPHAVSRLRGFYVFDDNASAHAATNAWGRAFRRDQVAEVGLLPGSRTSRHDANWITQHLGLGGSHDWMDHYLRGEPLAANPIWELVVDGRALVHGTGLRETAYGTVKRVWPASMALLELSRVGVQLGSDIGLITPMVLGTPPQLRVEFLMSFADATNPAFLARLAEFDGPKNTRDLGPSSELVVPDLRSQSFKLS